MDWSDDIAYSVHDVEDGIVSGRISLAVLWDLVELAALAEKGAKAFGGTADELLDAADSLRTLPIIREVSDFDFSLRSYTTLKKMTSEARGPLCRGHGAGHPRGQEPQLELGRQHGNLAVPVRAQGRSSCSRPSRCSTSWTNRCAWLARTASVSASTASLTTYPRGRRVRSTRCLGSGLTAPKLTRSASASSWTRSPR